MSQTCPNCGSENRLTNRFCSNCGTALAPAPASASAPGDAAATQPIQPGADRPDTGFMPPPTTPPGDVSYRVQRWEGADQPVEPVTPPAPPAFIPPPYSPSTSPQGAVPPPPPPQYAAAGTATGRQAGPPAELRAEGGTYLPYAKDVVRTLEDKKPERTWLIPTIVTLSVVLLALVSVGGYLWLNGRDSTGSAGTQAGSGRQAPIGSSEEEIIKQVIRQSNDEQIKAWRELDTEVLTGTRTGQVLQENIDAVEQLKSRDMYAVPVNHRLDFGKITINGNNATAETIEEWTVTFYQRSDDKVIDKDGPRLLSEVYYLVKQDGKWLISELDIENVPGITPVPGDVSYHP